MATNEPRPRAEKVPAVRMTDYVILATYSNGETVVFGDHRSRPFMLEADALDAADQLRGTALQAEKAAVASMEYTFAAARYDVRAVHRGVAPRAAQVTRPAHTLRECLDPDCGVHKYARRATS